jgi:glycerate kinase
MNIVIATDSFKGCCTTLEAAKEFKRGIIRVFHNAVINIIPIADGGEGTVNAVISALGGSLRNVRVCGPMGGDVTASFGLISEQEAVIEMAAASGLTLIKGEKDPLRASTYGTGQLIKAALDLGCMRIYIGIGGSATNDGGAGMAAALGARFLDADGREIPPSGGNLHLIEHIDITNLDKRLKGVNITAMSDVTNPLCGLNGASAVYGPQKGASPQQVELLDRGLLHFAEKVSESFHIDFKDVPGAGAAGGLGFGLLAFTGVDTLLG